MRKNDLSLKIILIIATVILIAFALYSISVGSHFKWDFFPLMIGLYLVFFLRKKLNLHPVHYMIFVLAIIVHNLGAFGFYSFYPLGFEYDYWVHGSWGFALAFLLYRALNQYPIPKIIKVIAILVIFLGLSASHELIEYGAAITLGDAFGKGEGIFFIGAGDIDEWDTQKDLLNGLIGAILALIFIWLWNLIHPKSTTSHYRTR